MILSQRQLEEIAASTTKDFNRFFFGDEADKPDRSALPTPIDQFAKNYLGLRVSFARLSPDGSICGVTAYADTEYKITELGITRTLALKRNQVILDESFILSGNVQRLCAKRRFTLAHVRPSDTFPTGIGRGKDILRNEILCTDSLYAARAENPRGLERVASKCLGRGNPASSEGG